MTGEQLVRVRAKLKVTRYGLALMLGVRETTVWRWEHGQRKIPRLAEVALRAFGIHEEDYGDSEPADF